MSFSQSMLAAAGNPVKLAELRELRATCARYALSFNENEKIDPAALTRQMTERGVDTATRMVVKSMLFRAGMIPA